MAAILSVILVITCRTKPVFELEWKDDGSNSYIKFGRNSIKNDWVRVTMTADIDRWRPFCQPILVIGCRKKLIFELEWEVDRSNPYMKFGRNQIKNDWVRVTTTVNIDRWWPFCRPSLVSAVGQNPYSNLKKKDDGSNSYIKFGRNPIRNDWVRVTTTADIDRWRPFCWPSWLSDVKFGRNRIKNAWVRVTTDRQTDKPKTIELRQHSLAGP